jgi:hypothetical protein
VQSGLLAAQAVQAQDAVGRPGLRGAPITPVKHEVYSATTFIAAKLALLPFAYAATAWSAALDAGRDKPGPLPADAYSPATAVFSLPLAFALDWWKTAYWLTKNVVADTAKSDGAKKGAADPADADAVVPMTDALTQLGVQALDMLGDGLQALAERQPSRGDAGAAASALPSALSAFTGQLLQTLRAVADRPAGPEQAPPGGPHQRRWRAKP